jgi:hypothetical protein
MKILKILLIFNKRSTNVLAYNIYLLINEGFKF